MHWSARCFPAIVIGADLVLHAAMSAAQANRSDVLRIGNGNAAMTVQSGRGNHARTVQVGDSNTASIDQSGDGNRAIAVQVGDNFDTEIQQSGNGSYSAVQQVGDGSGHNTVRNVSRGDLSISIAIGHRGARDIVRGNR